MSYDRVPTQFMKGIFITPHNFNDPENPQHGQYLNTQLKYDLYNSSVFSISDCEFSLIGVEEEEIKIEKIEQCNGPDPLWKLAQYANKNKHKEQEQMLSCMDWSVRKNATGLQKYRVKVYQTDRDFFYSQVHPPTIWKMFKLYMFR